MARGSANATAAWLPAGSGWPDEDVVLRHEVRLANQHQLAGRFTPVDATFDIDFTPQFARLPYALPCQFPNEPTVKHLPPWIHFKKRVHTRKW